MIPGHTATRSSTSTSLLDRAKQQDQRAWYRLVRLYAPLVYRQCRVMGVAAQDAPDVVQEVFRKVAGSISSFRHDSPQDSFRAWLTTIARNCVKDHFKGIAGRPTSVGGSDMHRYVQEMPDLDATKSSFSSPPDTNSTLVQGVIEDIRGDFENHTWEAFWLTTVEGIFTDDAAQQLGVSKWVVYQSKSRVLRRLRKELVGLLD